MKYRKSLVASLVISGLALGATGVASAHDGDRPGPADEPTTQIDTTEDGDIVQVQDVQEDNDDADNETDGDADRRRDGRRGNKLGTVAEAIGITAEELRAELREGSTIAEVAEANGVDAQDVIDAIVANKSERLDAKVEAGDITAEEAAEKLERKTERITNKINGVSNDAGADSGTSVEA